MTRVWVRTHAETCALSGVNFTGNQMYLQMLSGCYEQLWEALQKVFFALAADWEASVLPLNYARVIAEG